jgi:hypothetical protein
MTWTGAAVHLLDLSCASTVLDTSFFSAYLAEFEKGEDDAQSDHKHFFGRRFSGMKGFFW